VLPFLSPNSYISIIEEKTLTRSADGGSRSVREAGQVVHISNTNTFKACAIGRAPLSVWERPLTARIHMPGKPRTLHFAFTVEALVRDTDLNEAAGAADATRGLSQES